MIKCRTVRTVAGTRLSPDADTALDSAGRAGDGRADAGGAVQEPLSTCGTLGWKA